MAIPDWINVIPSSGNNSSTIDIVVDKNEGEERTYDLTVKDPDNPSLHKTISITQAATNERSIKVQAVLRAFGDATAGTVSPANYKSSYLIRAISNYKILGGYVQVKVEYNGATYLLKIEENNTISNEVVVLRTDTELNDINRFNNDPSSDNYIGNFLTVLDIGGSSQNVIPTVDKVKVEVANTGIISINNININEDTFQLNDVSNLSLGNPFSTDIVGDTTETIGEFVSKKILNMDYWIVSWAYRGGFNLLSYKETKTTSMINGTGNIIFKFNLLETKFNNGETEGYYMDVWNCLYQNGYKPVTSFELYLNFLNYRLVEYKLQNITTLSTSIFVNTDTSGNLSINTSETYKLGKSDYFTAYALGIKNSNGSIDSTQTCWYHKPLTEGQTLVDTVIRRVFDTDYYFSENVFHNTSCSYNIIVYSGLDSEGNIKTPVMNITNPENYTSVDSERFYHPNPNILPVNYTEFRTRI